MRFGRQLREERERQGVSLEEIAASTRVPLRQLQSLEADLFDELPPGVVRRGIVRSYCKHIGLDEKTWMEQFAAAGGLAQEEPDQEKLAAFAENVRRSRPNPDPIRTRWLWVLLMVVVLVGAGYAAWRFIVRPRVYPAPPAIQAPTEAAPEAPAPVPTAPAPDNPAPRTRRRHRPALPETAAPVN